MLVESTAFGADVGRLGLRKPRTKPSVLLTQVKHRGGLELLWRDEAAIRGKRRSMNQISPGQFHGIRQVVVNGKILDDCQANRSCLISWLHEDQGETIQSITPTWLRKVLAENPQLESQLAWVSAKFVSREEFNQFACVNGLSAGDANWHLAGSVLGKKFNETDLVRAFNSGALRFAPRSAEELDQDAQQDREKQARDDRKVLLGNDVNAAKEVAQRQSAAQRRTAQQEQLEHQLVSLYQQQVTFGTKQKLPTHWNGERIDAAFIKNAPPAVLKQLLNRFGSAQLDAKLSGISYASAYLDFGDGRGPVLTQVDFT